MQIFPKHPSAPDTYHIGGAWTPACITAVDKRFHPGELAAEYWKMRYDHEYEALMLEEFRSTPHRTKAIYYWCDALSMSRERMEVLERFNRLPHYDENPA